jgi:hypothetical protein
MGQFKPMVKMMTTEPSVELKLKKGGSVKKAMGGDMMGDAMPDFSSMRGSLGAPRGGMDMAMAPKKPSMAKRKKAMSPKASAKVMSAIPVMKEGGDMAQDKAMVKKAFKQHDAQEHKGGKGTKLSLKKGGKMATGGVSSGAGGYASGGIIKSTSGETKMVTAKSNGKTNFATGGVTSGAGGYKKGGKAMMDGGMVGGNMMGNPMMDDGMMRNRMMGGYKKGGAPKKFAEGGLVQDDGRPQKMPQGNKPPSKPVSITRLSGSFKKGGGVKKMQSGGSMSEPDPIIDRENARMQAEKNAERADNEAMREMILGAPKRILQGAKRMIGMGEGAVSDKEPKAITKTEKSVTISPAKKNRGGAVC